MNSARPAQGLARRPRTRKRGRKIAGCDECARARAEEAAELFERKQSRRAEL
jgi:hypothetical protein